MRRLVEIELAKLASREFRTSFVAYAALLPVGMLSLRAFRLEAPAGSSGADPLGFPDVWANAAYVAGWIDYLLYVIVLQTIALEYHWRTNRQNIVDGLSRAEYVAGKVFLLFLAAFVSTALVFGLAAVFGLCRGGTRVMMEPAVSLVTVRYPLQVLGYASLAMLIATLARRSGVAVLAFLAYTLIAEPLALALLLPSTAGRWLPSHVFASLVPNPLFGYVGMRTAAAPLWPTVTLGVGWTAAFVAASAFAFARQDL